MHSSTVGAIPPLEFRGWGDDLLLSEPGIPWGQIARMRDHLAHRYFDTSHAVIQGTVDYDLPELEEAVGRLDARLAGTDTIPDPADP